MRVTDLELTIRPSSTGYVAEARLALAQSQVDSVLAADIPVVLAPDTLLPLTLDPAAYGRALTAQLFSDQRLRDAWRSVRALADGADTSLRLRLRLPATAHTLHTLRWETLRDPLTEVPLATDSRLRLTRSLDSPETRAIKQRQRDDLRVLLVVANPSDLRSYGFAKIDVEGEVRRVRRALGSLPLTVVGDHDGAVSRRATLGTAHAALSAGPSILGLICHGQHTEDGTMLWLEDDMGRTSRVPGSAFAEMLAQLPQPPLLVVLSACESGSVNHHVGALAALGPRLAMVGVGAVVAMQAKLSMTAAETFLPALFSDLLAEGAIDRAVSVGRATLREGSEWWIPVLWLRVRDGRLWPEEVAQRPTESQPFSAQKITLQQRLVWQQMLEQRRQALMLINERISEYVEYQEVPLQLLKNQRQTIAQIRNLEEKLNLYID